MGSHRAETQCGPAGLLECVVPGMQLIRLGWGHDKAGLPCVSLLRVWPPSDLQHTPPSISLSICWPVCLSNWNNCSYFTFANVSLETEVWQTHFQVEAQFLFLELSTRSSSGGVRSGVMESVNVSSVPVVISSIAFTELACQQIHLHGNLANSVTWITIQKKPAILSLSCIVKENSLATVLIIDLSFY